MNLFHFFFFTIGRLLRFLIKEICKRSHVKIYGRENFLELASRESCLLVAWHHHVLMVDQGVLPSSYKSVVLADAHHLGKIASGLARFSKVIEVPASPEKKHKSLIKFMRALEEERSVGVIAPDGPIGPARRVKPGSIVIAKKLGMKIVPCSFASSRTWYLPRWDRMQIPKPGSHIAVHFGAPLDVSMLSLEEGSKLLENALNQLERQASESICSSR